LEHDILIAPKHVGYIISHLILVMLLHYRTSKVQKRQCSMGTSSLSFFLGFSDIRLDLQTQVMGHSRSSEPTRIDPPPPINVLYQPRAISYHFRDKRPFQSKIANFSHIRVFCDPAEAVPLRIGYRRWEEVKKLKWWGYRTEKEVWRYLQPSGYNTPTWQTDGRTDTGR